MTAKKKKKSLFGRLWFLLLIPLLLLMGYVFTCHFPNTNFETEYYDYNVLNDSLSQNDEIEPLKSSLKLGWTFDIASKFYGQKVSKGLYLISRGASNYEIIKLLELTPRPTIHVKVGNIRFRYNLTSSVCKKLDVRSRAVRRELNNIDFIQSLDTAFTKENVYGIFIQDSIWIHRDATAHEVIKSVHRKWQRYWTTEKKEQAKEMGLSPMEVTILASIIHSESQELEELPRIAGVYLNRLRSDMRLQADPTVVFAWKKNIRRVLKKHLRTRNLYNTYRYNGLPPGPVFTTSKHAIEAVLNEEKHDFLYFVANPELDGKHDFSTTYEEHLEKARSYRKILNKKRIFK